MDDFEITTESLDQGQIALVVAGELDMATAPQLETALLRAIEAGPRSVLLDLTPCSFIDSTALTVLTKTKHTLNGGGLHQVAPRLQIVAPDGIVLKVLTITKLDQVFEVYPDRDEAMNDSNGRSGSHDLKIGSLNGTTDTRSTQAAAASRRPDEHPSRMPVVEVELAGATAMLTYRRLGSILERHGLRMYWRTTEADSFVLAIPVPRARTQREAEEVVAGFLDYW